MLQTLVVVLSPLRRRSCLSEKGDHFAIDNVNGTVQEVLMCKTV